MFGRPLRIFWHLAQVMNDHINITYLGSDVPQCSQIVERSTHCQAVTVPLGGIRRQAAEVPLGVLRRYAVTVSLGLLRRQAVGVPLGALRRQVVSFFDNFIRL